MLARKIYYLSKLRKTQYRDTEWIREFQLKQLKSVVEQAYAGNKFYRNKWEEHGFHPGQIETLEDIKKIPVTSREEIQENFPEPIMVNPSVFRRSTSGSSGREPLTVAWDEQAYDFSEAVYLRALMNVGYKPWEKKAYYWYREFDRSTYNNFFMRKHRIDNDLSTEEQLEELEEADLDTWYYYGGILFTLAKKVLREPDKWDLDPERIITHAEILTSTMKKTIEEAFEAPVHDEYGSTEFNRMAWQCEEGNYHLDSESIFFEFKDTELGPEPICTSLVKVGMPMIRYEMGDIVSPVEESCECGRGLPMIEPVEGRKKNFINSVSPRDIIESIAGNRDMLMFQVFKDESGIKLVYVPNKGCGEESIKKTASELSVLLDQKVSIEETDFVEKTWAGKRPMVVNESE